MKIGALLKYSVYLLIMILATFMILTLYIYFFSKKPALELAYTFVVPVCMFIVTLFYAKSIHEKGLVRGLEMWIIYFAIVLILKFIFNSAAEIGILKHAVYLPISILAGVIGVNLK